MNVKSTGWLVILVLGVVLVVAGLRLFGSETAKGQTETLAAAAPALSGPAAVAVEAAPVTRELMSRSVSAVGTLRSRDSVILRSEITGRIAELDIREGGKVAKGQLILRLDDSVAKAQLQQAQANLSLARSQASRAAQLSREGFISKQARDEADSQLQVQQAAVALAKAQLEKTAIVAPFEGLIGLRDVSLGDYVGPGDALVPIESINPLQVDFRIPEQYLALVHPGLALNLSFDALPSQIREGVVDAISPSIDVGGRSILLRANVANDDDALRPGMFTRVTLRFSDENVLAVPEAAIVPAGEERYVYRVRDGKAEKLQVVTGQRRPGRVEIVSGLAAGDLVIVAGQQKVADATPVKVLERPHDASAS